MNALVQWSHVHKLCIPH